MKLKKKEILFVTFMLFSLFFGAGNLIFPPFLGQKAGNNTFIALGGFLITAVVLPVLGIIVVSRSGGLDLLGQRVSKSFGIGFAVIIYLAIGPGLGIPRAASVPFEMAVAPYLPSETNNIIWMIVYSLIFFIVALWLCLKPSKLVDRIGRVLTPILLFLLLLLFVVFLFKGDKNIVTPQESYRDNPFLKGFGEGYNTMDAIAALNFGLVISSTLTSLGVKEKNDQTSLTLKTGSFAGLILAVIYFMLSYMGMASSGVYGGAENGAVILRYIVHQLFGDFGAIILAATFTLACLTTCVGLITSISQYFSKLFKKISYKKWVFIITIISFVICNLGLNTILSISVPILNAIYPISIVLILLGISHKLWEKNKIIYPCVICGVGIISIIYVLEQLNLRIENFSQILNNYLPLYSLGYGWVPIAVFLILASVLIDLIIKKIMKKKTIIQEAQANSENHE